MPERPPTVIELPTDEARVAQLRRKLAEYDGRVLDTAKSLHQRFGAVCKQALLARALTNGRVVVEEVEQELRDYYGDNFEYLRFRNAYDVVSDYCLTGGEMVVGGGLR